MAWDDSQTVGAIATCVTALIAFLAYRHSKKGSRIVALIEEHPAIIPPDYSKRISFFASHLKVIFSRNNVNCADEDKFIDDINLGIAENVKKSRVFHGDTSLLEVTIYNDSNVPAANIVFKVKGAHLYCRESSIDYQVFDSNDDGIVINAIAPNQELKIFVWLGTLNLGWKNEIILYEQGGKAAKIKIAKKYNAFDRFIADYYSHIIIVIASLSLIYSRFF